MLRRFSGHFSRWIGSEKFATLRPLTKESRSNYSIYEPDYLSAFEPQQPIYDLLNIQIKAYDFPVLERFQSYVHKTANKMGLLVEDSWATPAQVIQVNSLKINSTILDKSYKLNLYERNVQIAQFPCSLAPVFFEIIHTCLPEGVQLSIHADELEHQEIRYIPDVELIGLKTQLEDLNIPAKKRKK